MRKGTERLAALLVGATCMWGSAAWAQSTPPDAAKPAQPAAVAWPTPAAQAAAAAQVADPAAQAAAPTAQAAVQGDAAAPVVAPAPKPVLSKPYYIEFRSRSARSYGHTFSIYGRLDGNGKIATKAVAGLHPFTESELPWMVGHLVLVPSETGASDGDTEDQYVTSRFQVRLSAEEYKKVTGHIKELQKNSPMWHAVLYNCNAFVGDIAHFMGMEKPSSTMLMPAEYIDSLRDLNIAKTKVIGTPTRVESAEKLRASALKNPGKGKSGASPKPATPAQTTELRPNLAPN